MSSPYEPRDTYTVRRSDGNVETTTQVRTKYEEDVEVTCGPGSLDSRYCCRPPGILRIVEMAFCFVIVCLIASVWGPGPFKGVLFGQTFILLFAGACVCITFIFLLVYFFRLHISHLVFWPWGITDLAFSATACVIFAICGFLEAYYATGAWSNNCNDIGGDGIIHNGCRTIIEWAMASALMFILAILFGVSAAFARKTRRYE